MEITKTEKFNLADISVRAKRSPLATRVQALELGEGFVVDGVERDVIISKITPLRREGRVFQTHKLAPLRFQVIRVG